MLGQVVKQISIAGTSFDVPLSGFEQGAGMYLVEVANGNTGQIFKLIKL